MTLLIDSLYVHCDTVMLKKGSNIFHSWGSWDMTNKCGSDGRPPLGVSGAPSTLHAMVQHGFLNEGCTTRYSSLAQFQGYKPLMYGIKPDYVRSVTKNGMYIQVHRRSKSQSSAIH